MMDVSLEILPYLFIVGFLAGLVDSIAGGGGLIALPAILFTGLPPQIALGTNKLQGTFGTFSASYNYIQKGQANWRDALSGIAFTFIGATSGAWLVQWLKAEFIKPLIPVLLLIVFVYTLFSQSLGLEDIQPKIKKHAFYAIFGLGLGFYDGFFGPGTGSFWTVGLIFFLGLNITKATGYTKIMNFTSNIAALSCFAIGDNVCYPIGITMGVGQIIGARVGSNLAVKKGIKVIRPIFLTVVFLTIVRLIYVNYHL